MQAFSQHQGRLAPLDRQDVDTDQIIPKIYLLRVVKEGYGETLFDDWRYLDAGEPDGDHSQRRPNPDFVLNQPRYAHSSILLTRDNFGCGSSREHAVWALMQYGFRAVIAVSYSDIFFDNAFRNGLLLIHLERQLIDELFALEAASDGLDLAIDLKDCSIEGQGGPSPFACRFTIDDAYRKALLAGLDDIGASLERLGEIRDFERRYLGERPWLDGAARK